MGRLALMLRTPVRRPTSNRLAEESVAIFGAYSPGVSSIHVVARMRPTTFEQLIERHPEVSVETS